MPSSVRGNKGWDHWNHKDEDEFQDIVSLIVFLSKILSQGLHAVFRWFWVIVVLVLML